MGKFKFKPIKLGPGFRPALPTTQPFSSGSVPSAPASTAVSGLASASTSSSEVSRPRAQTVPKYFATPHTQSRASYPQTSRPTTVGTAQRSSLPSTSAAAEAGTAGRTSLPHATSVPVTGTAKRSSLSTSSASDAAASSAKRPSLPQTSTANGVRPLPDPSDADDLSDFDLDSSSFISTQRPAPKPGRCQRRRRTGVLRSDSDDSDGDDCVVIGDDEFQAAVTSRRPEQTPTEISSTTPAPVGPSEGGQDTTVRSITPPPDGLLSGLSSEPPPPAESPLPPPPPPDMDVDDLIDWHSPETAKRTAAGGRGPGPEPEEEEVIGSSQPAAQPSGTTVGGGSDIGSVIGRVIDGGSGGRNNIGGGGGGDGGVKAVMNTPASSAVSAANTARPGQPSNSPPGKAGLRPQAVKLAVRLADMLESLPPSSLDHIPGLDSAKCRRLLKAYRQLTGRPVSTTPPTPAATAAGSDRGTGNTPASWRPAATPAGTANHSSGFRTAGATFSSAGATYSPAGTASSPASAAFSPASTTFSPPNVADFKPASSASKTATSPAAPPLGLLSPPAAFGAGGGGWSAPQPSGSSGAAGTPGGANYGTSTRDDSRSEEFRKTHPFSERMHKVFREMFGLRSFRTNQKEVITAALLNHDTFVLMPTGGGKSLCYQLPALLDRGVTVVISPLKSLIRDQISKLNSLDIPAAHLSGLNSSGTSGHGVYMDLSQARPGVKLLYTTPEMVGASGRLKDALTSLYKRGLLSRLVIDEAHCVSQWGHDFRPDYKRLCELRRSYPNTPVMALTATATPRVRGDILHQLGLDQRNVKWFISSFNRTNLRYEVLPKTSTVTSDMAAFIRGQHSGHTGIVYCFSKKDCDQLAAALRKERIPAAAYHADLSDPQRGEVQDQWLAGKVKVICATIAFGMGVDKPNVRFVLHHALPKSLEGFYQESGRAGRDGQKADCVLYYRYRDYIRVRTMLAKSRENAEAHRTHEKNLWDILRYAENITDCRRSLVLQYFGERFDRAACRASPNTACDNCRRQGQTVEQEVTSLARDIVGAVRDICSRTYGGNFTQQQVVDLLKGSRVKKIMDNGLDRHSLHGSLKDWSRADCERLMRHLVLEKYLLEEMVAGREDIVNAYLRLGPRAKELTAPVGAQTEVRFTKSRQQTSTSAGRSDSAPASSSDDIEQRAALRELCLERLTELCQELARAAATPQATIINRQALHDMADRLPTDRLQMLQITHVTEANFAKYGERLLEAIRPYAEQAAKLDEQAAAVAAAAKTGGEGKTAGSRASAGKKPGRRRRGRGGGVAAAAAGGQWAAAAARNRALAVGRGRGRGAAGARPAALGLVAPAQPRSFLGPPRTSLL